MSGNTHFYCKEFPQGYERIFCINALCRAILISTVPFVNPHKIRALQAYFCTLFTEFSENGIFNTFVTFSEFKITLMPS